ncbi:MAG: HU family DNA-binding protein, partial [Erysipelotrichaceae bacterium]|nr:HU family DNA-binding protein [Erysipelotrichaceae bacterium]
MMNKPELVKSISEKSGLELRDTEKLLSSFVEIITEAMQK